MQYHLIYNILLTTVNIVYTIYIILLLCTYNFVSLMSRLRFSSLQRRCQRKRTTGKIMQQVLAVSRRLPKVAEVSGHVSVRQAHFEVRCAANRGL